METHYFTHEPSFAELWEVCVNTFWDREAFADEFTAYVTSLGVAPGASILDVAAGGGFPAFELADRGYKMSCTDLSKDEKIVFDQEACRRKQRAIPYQQLSWKNMPDRLVSGVQDVLICRGGSLIYAGGGWNEKIEIDVKTARQKIQDALKIFYDLLKDGGWLYVDKFKDTEVTHKTAVAHLQTADDPPETMFFWAERDPKQKIRQASLIRRKQDGTEICVPNIAYDLHGCELVEMLQHVGFQKIRPVHLTSEPVYDAWIAQK